MSLSLTIHFTSITSIHPAPSTLSEITYDALDSTMKYSEAIILTIMLVVVFCVFFGWCLYKSCSRAIDAEFQELAYRKDVQAQAVANGETGNGSGAQA
ncbi:Nn.00g041460.m01.CDS01 [Neocucurbitaria sp. VM-36]